MLHSPLLLAETITPLQALVLGAVQGLTELLPVSSSAHLYALPTMLGWKYEGVAFDVALHGGTLVALVIAFWSDWLTLLRDAFSDNRELARDARMMWAKLVVATIPAAIAGKLLDQYADTALRQLPLQATMLVLFGLLLWLVDRARPGREQRSPGWGTAMAMGLAQCVALVPGVSRSGITMTAGRASGLSRVSAARFSFLLATPITAGALVLKLKDVPNDVPAATLVIAVVSAAVFGILAIQFLLRMLRTAGFGAFFAYRAAFAAVIVVWLARH
jgi:undecaprenyl-diphosphatase